MRTQFKFRSNVLFITCLLIGANAVYAWQADNGDGTFTNPLFYDEFSDPDLIRVPRHHAVVPIEFVPRNELVGRSGVLEILPEQLDRLNNQLLQIAPLALRRRLTGEHEHVLHDGIEVRDRFLDLRNEGAALVPREVFRVYLITQTVEILVQPRVVGGGTLSFLVHSPRGREVYNHYPEATSRAEEMAVRLAREAVREAGAEAISVRVNRQEVHLGRLPEMTVRATASGRPRLEA